MRRLAGRSENLMTQSPQFDVLILGAGLSGIGAACHLTRKLPHKSYAILERRDAIGGTWDLFRYPGIRSDSDMSTFGYNFRPWREPKVLADGPSIKRYVSETAQQYDVIPKIRFGRKVVHAAWSSSASMWNGLTRQATATPPVTCQNSFRCSDEASPGRFTRFPRNSPRP